MAHDGARETVDPRARRSMMALRHALLEVAAIKDLSQVSVSDLVRRAGVSRSTFYEHYADVHDLAESVSTQLFDDLIASQAMTAQELALVVSPSPPDNPLTPLFAHFQLHAPLYRSLLGAEGSARVINHLLHRVTVGAHTNVRVNEETSTTHADDPEDSPDDPEMALVAGAILGVTIEWLRRDCPQSPEALAGIVWPQLLAAALANRREGEA